MSITPLNFLHLKNGEFGATTRAELTRLFDAFAAGNTRNLAVHFHGGLVNKDHALLTAERLLPEYQQTSIAYPVFFIWESGLLEVMRNNAEEIAEEVFFKELLRMVAQFAGGKVLHGIGERVAGQVKLLDGVAIQAELARATAGEETFAEMTEERRRAVSEMTETEAMQFRALLERNQEFMAEVELISQSVEPPDHLARSRGATTTGSRRTLMSPSVLAALRDERIPNTEESRGIFGASRLIKGSITVAARVISRFANEREHGFHATIVEEILREFYVSAVGQEIWRLMKKDTADAFGENPMLFGGSAFLQEIARVDPRNEKRILLAGHSAGSEFICNLLRNVDRFLPADFKFDIVLMAPACRTDFFADTVRHQAGHIRSIRMYTMFDELEKKDRLVPLLYPHSLLYFISGVLENEADKPILGMERYFVSKAKHYQKPETAIPEVRAFFNQPTRKVFSVSMGTPGLESNSLSHIGFDDTQNARATIDSIQFILRRGF